jgi:DNA-binding IscR family transcriptional regulator
VGFFFCGSTEKLRTEVNQPNGPRPSIPPADDYPLHDTWRGLRTQMMNHLAATTLVDMVTAVTKKKELLQRQGLSDERIRYV